MLRREEQMNARKERGNPRREQVMDCIATYRIEHDMSPVVSEIAAAIGVSRSTVWHHLKILRDMGFVSMDSSRARSLRILRPWEVA